MGLIRTLVVSVVLVGIVGAAEAQSYLDRMTNDADRRLRDQLPCDPVQRENMKAWMRQQAQGAPMPQLDVFPEHCRNAGAATGNSPPVSQRPSTAQCQAMWARWEAQYDQDDYGPQARAFPNAYDRSNQLLGEVQTKCGLRSAAEDEAWSNRVDARRSAQNYYGQQPVQQQQQAPAGTTYCQTLQAQIQSGNYSQNLLAAWYGQCQGR